MKKYTFNKLNCAWSITGLLLYIPDQVYENQKDYDGKTFPVVIDNTNSPYTIWDTALTRRARARLMGDLYGLHTTGTGVPVVKIV